MLRNSNSDRTLRENLMLASSTAFVSGIINVAGAIAFLAFTSNITGHVANLARHAIQQNFTDLIVLLAWLFAFFAGAFISSFMIRSLSHRSHYYAHAMPIVLEILVLLFVAFYGDNFYRETGTERAIVTGAVLFSMGLQNSMVSALSGGLIKSSHLTGLFTDLGSDIAVWLHPASERKEITKNKIYLRLTILFCYFLGGLAGAYFFEKFEFVIFYFIPLILLTILYYDLAPFALHRLMRLFSVRDKN